MAELRLDVAVPLRAFELRVALDVASETVAVVGPSGAGKSTLLRAVAGLTHARGHVRVDGEDWSSRPPERRSIGFVFQDYALFPHLTVRGNVAFGGRPDDVLERLGIAHLADARPRELSGGERQRVALARALANNPSLLLADEPTGSLDTAATERVLALVESARERRGMTMLVVTYDSVVAARADRILHMRDGRLVPEDADALRVIVR
jgi:molybdate transport system ATP-binding protein